MASAACGICGIPPNPLPPPPTGARRNARDRKRAMIRSSLAAGLLATMAYAVPAQPTRLLRHPALSRDAIAFEYGGDLWIVPRAGGQARRLTATPEMETEPRFSPDGA